MYNNLVVNKIKYYHPKIESSSEIEFFLLTETIQTSKVLDLFLFLIESSKMIGNVQKRLTSKTFSLFPFVFICPPSLLASLLAMARTRLTVLVAVVGIIIVIGGFLVSKKYAKREDDVSPGICLASRVFLQLC